MNKIKLFCIPFAGGSKYSYRGYIKSSPSDLEILPIELPGRGTRYKEPLLTDMNSLVEDVFFQIKDDLEEPYAIYGHSMGTLLGYLVTRKIIKEGYPQPKALFVTGRGGPSVIDDEPPRYLLPKHKFLEKLKELGGSPDEILNDKSMMDFFEPILRADFQAIETYRHCVSEPFDIPIYVTIGSMEKTTLEEARAWQYETKAEVEVKVLPGKHFFIFDFESNILENIRQKLISNTVSQ